MSDSYQAVYDAVRSRIGNCDIAGAVAEVARQNMPDMGSAISALSQEIAVSFHEHARPSAVYRPTLSIDGNQWCALYGDNLQDGVAGFGNTPAAAMAAFDAQWAKPTANSTGAQAK